MWPTWCMIIVGGWYLFGSIKQCSSIGNTRVLLPIAQTWFLASTNTCLMEEGAHASKLGMGHEWQITLMPLHLFAKCSQYSCEALSKILASPCHSFVNPLQVLSKLISVLSLMDLPTERIPGDSISQSLSGCKQLVAGCKRKINAWVMRLTGCFRRRSPSPPCMDGSNVFWTTRVCVPYPNVCSQLWTLVRLPISQFLLAIFMRLYLQTWTEPPLHLDRVDGVQMSGARDWSCVLEMTL